MATATANVICTILTFGQFSADQHTDHGAAEHQDQDNQSDVRSYFHVYNALIAIAKTTIVVMKKFDNLHGFKNPAATAQAHASYQRVRRLGCFATPQGSAMGRKIFALRGLAVVPGSGNMAAHEDPP